MAADVGVVIADTGRLLLPAISLALKFVAASAGIQRDIKHAGTWRFDDGGIVRDAGMQ
jgi:hypothetical protein